MKRTFLVTAQYEENYGFADGGEHWKMKGGMDFEFDIDFDLMMYADNSEVKEVLAEVLAENSNDLERFTYVDHTMKPTTHQIDGDDIAKRLQAKLSA